MSDPTTPRADETAEVTETTEAVESNVPHPPEPAAPRRGRRRALVAGSVAALLLVLGGGGVVAANAHKVVTLEADGQQIETGSWRGSVAGLLDDQGITLGEHDEVIPALDTPLADGADIQVLRAQPVDITVDGEQQVLWTTAEDAGSALAAAAFEGRTTQLTVSRSSGRSEIDLPISGDLRVESVIDGEKTETVPTGTTLQAALDQLGLELGDSDEISVSADTDGTTVVTIIRVVASERVESVAVPHASSTVKSDSYYTGTTKVTTAGVDGALERRYAVTTRDGVVVSDELVSETTVTAPVDEVVTVGTKARPAATPKASSSSSAASSSSSSSSSSASSSSSVGGDVWAALAQCESGGNPASVSSSGKYYGLYQFTVSTWKSVGGSGLPSEASAAEQTQRAQALQARSGWGQWPACARKLGLL